MIVLVGFMGAGKSTIGPKLAAELGLPFTDTDAELENEFGTSIAQFFEEHGEAAFRRREATLVLGTLESGTDRVVALGGGSAADPAVAAALEWSRVVYLRASFADIRVRLRADMSRPLMQGGDLLALYQERCSLYERIANISFDTDRREPDDVVREIAAWAAPPHGAPGREPFKKAAPPPPPPLFEAIPQPPTRSDATTSIQVELGDRSYPIHVDRGAINRVGELFPDNTNAENILIIGDSNVSELSRSVAGSLAGAGKKVHLFELPLTEAAKNLAQAGALLDSFAAVPAHRSDLVVTVGGGVTSDLGGFVASVYARGLDVVHCPTTLLGQVDAAIGGKCGVNLPAGKNLVGTIHQPRSVICDVDVLDTLPLEELRSGMAEVLKYGFIGDPDLLELCVAEAPRILEKDKDLLQDIVLRSARAKAAVVSADETETGMRAHLNYGHTFAHALEQGSGFDLRHGEAVALGMMAAAFVAEGMGSLDAAAVEMHEAALKAFDLPTRSPMSLEEMEEAWQRDKKYQGGVRFVLLEGLGKPQAGVAVDREVLLRALERMSE
jgi:3-dehydroquinate synthase